MCACNDINCNDNIFLFFTFNYFFTWSSLDHISLKSIVAFILPTKWSFPFANSQKMVEALHFLFIQDWLHRDTHGTKCQSVCHYFWFSCSQGLWQTFAFCGWSNNTRTGVELNQTADNVSHDKLMRDPIKRRLSDQSDQRKEQHCMAKWSSPFHSRQKCFLSFPSISFRFHVNFGTEKRNLSVHLAVLQQTICYKGRSMGQWHFPNQAMFYIDDTCWTDAAVTCFISQIVVACSLQQFWHSRHLWFVFHVWFNPNHFVFASSHLPCWSDWELSDMSSIGSCRSCLSTIFYCKDFFASAELAVLAGLSFWSCNVRS